MKPILLIHGYSTEGKDNTVEDIYGSLPEELRKLFGSGMVFDLNLSRWISLNNGITLDDVSFAMDRALKEEFPDLLTSDFHVIIHSTGALVVRNWIKEFSPKPSPIKNLIHLAGANFGSGLAHIGQGQLSRWKNRISGTGVGTKVLNELEFGSWKTIDLHRYFLDPANSMYSDYKVQEYCIIGSQTLPSLRLVPIRYLKEDSADNTVRTSAGNLNFNYIPVKPTPDAFHLSIPEMEDLIQRRFEGKSIADKCYNYNLAYLGNTRQEIPFCIAYETAHFGENIGVVSGKQNRKSIMPLIKRALETPYEVDEYNKTVEVFAKARKATFTRVAKLKNNIFEWNKQSQYEGHAQLIFRLRDQFGNAVEHFDITFKSKTRRTKDLRFEKMIEDRHINKKDKGSMTFYLRTQNFERKKWVDQLGKLPPVNIEITGHEPLSEDIAYVPMNISLNRAQIQTVIETFKTTIIDITLLRLPSEKVFAVSRR